MSRKSGKADPEDAKLCPGTEDEGLGIGNQRAKVGHGPQAKKDKGRYKLGGDAAAEHPGKQADRFTIRSDLHQSAEWQVDQKDSKTDGNKQERLHFPSNTEIDKEPPDKEHYYISPGQRPEGTLI
jgi:hypothetical protein